jgi:guanosine-3',5'-bis(diphosphate) 3'-pyrophosphohydrolase
MGISKLKAHPLEMNKVKLDKYISSQYRSLLQIISDQKRIESTDAIRKAFDIALEACGEDKRKSGEYQISYCIEVAKIAVSEIGLGISSVNAIFLNEALIRGKITIIEIEKRYKDKQLVIILNGLAKISDLDTTTNDKTQAENFRKLLLNMAEDMRVILIRLAQQLRTMRQMKNLDEILQYKISTEAFYLYAPLAHRLGLYIIKSEMEDLALKYTEKDTYQHIAKKLDEKMKARKSFISKFIKPIDIKLKQQGFDFEIKGRPKSIFSIWSKMKKKGVEFEDIYDLFAIRIILNSEEQKEKADCWQVYSTVTDLYQPNPKRLRDWISVPKTNGYESLHTTVVGPDGKWVEVQIRTKRMNEIAEKGFAAHWKYKGIQEEQGLDEWLVKIRDILETPEPDAVEFIDDFKLSLYSKEIFVFTPKGDLRKFPAGASVLDFAFDIHSDIGSTCSGAKVNGKNVSLKYKLQNGDAIEILRSKTQTPKLDWLNIVVTSKAKAKIRQKLNEEQVKEADNGKEILKRRLKNWKIDFSDEVIRNLLNHYKIKTAQELYYQISKQKVDIAEIKEIINKHEEEEKTVDEPKLIKLDGIIGEEYKEEVRRSEDLLVIDEQVGEVDYKLAKCCNPIFGDKIFGFVTINEGIKIHRASCPNARQMLNRYGYRIVKAAWTRPDGDTLYPVELKLTGIDDFNILTKINDTISKDNRVKLRAINMDSGDGLFEAKIKLMVNDIHHLDALINKMKSIKGVIDIQRFEFN